MNKENEEKTYYEIGFEKMIEDKGKKYYEVFYGEKPNDFKTVKHRIETDERFKEFLEERMKKAKPSDEVVIEYI